MTSAKTTTSLNILRKTAFSLTKNNTEPLSNVREKSHNKGTCIIIKAEYKAAP